MATKAEIDQKIVDNITTKTTEDQITPDGVAEILTDLNEKVYDEDLVLSTDVRLSDSRTPISHTHTKSEITDFNEGDYATAAQGVKADSALQGASNGLSIDLTSGDVELGGSITKPTSIDISDADTLTFNATTTGSVNEMRFSNSDFNVNFGDGSPFSDSTNLEVSSNRVSFRRGDTSVLIEGLDLRINPENSTLDNSQNGYVLSKKDSQGGTEWIPPTTGYTGSYTVNSGGTTITVVNGIITNVTQSS